MCDDSIFVFFVHFQSLVEIIALTISAAACGCSFYHINPIAGYLFAPYVAWLSYATFLNYTIYKRNPRNEATITELKNEWTNSYIEATRFASSFATERNFEQKKYFRRRRFDIQSKKREKIKSKKLYYTLYNVVLGLSGGGGLKRWRAKVDAGNKM